VATNQAVAV